jgi:hypothetical protein
MPGLSDKARAVLAFAAYHQLASGETVKDVVLHDGAGHAAEPAAIRELEAVGNARVEHDRAVFTPQGQRALEKVVAAIRAVDLTP